VPSRLRDIAIDLSPLKVREFRLLWTGATISAIGTMITRIAVPFQVYRLTGSTLWVGILGGLALIPYMVGGIVGGAIADAHDRRNVSRIVSVVCAVCSAGLALNSASLKAVWLIFVLSILQTGAQAIGAPSGRSAVPLLVSKEMLPSAAAVQSVSYTSAFVLGPAIGGVLLGLVGATGAYLVDLATFVAPIVTWTLMAPLPPMADAEPPSRATIVDGLRVLKGRPVLMASFLADLNAMVFGMPTALFPAVVDQRFGGNEHYLGLIAAAPFAGAFVASMTSGWCKRVHRHGLAVIVSVAVWGLGIIGFGLVDGATLTFASLAVAGAADMISGVYRQSLLQTAAPREMLGRMEGVGMAVWTSGPALGDLEAGAVAAATSVNTSIVSGGVACIAGIAVMAVAMPGFRKYDARVGMAAALAEETEGKTGDEAREADGPDGPDRTMRDAGAQPPGVVVDAGS
jgi:MFS family permease